MVYAGAALTDLDEEGEKLADITLITPQEDPHGQQVYFEIFLFIIELLDLQLLYFLHLARRQRNRPDPPHHYS